MRPDSRAMSSSTMTLVNLSSLIENFWMKNFFWQDFFSFDTLVFYLLGWGRYSKGLKSRSNLLCYISDLTVTMEDWKNCPLPMPPFAISNFKVKLPTANCLALNFILTFAKCHFKLPPHFVGLKYCSDDGVLRNVKRNVFWQQAKISIPPA